MDQSFFVKSIPFQEYGFQKDNPRLSSGGKFHQGLLVIFGDDQKRLSGAINRSFLARENSALVGLTSVDFCGHGNDG